MEMANPTLPMAGMPIKLTGDGESFVLKTHSHASEMMSGINNIRLEGN